DLSLIRHHRVTFTVYLHRSPHHHDLPTFPTRRSSDLVHATEVDLEGRYTVRRSGRGADFGGEIGEGGEVVSGKGCFHRKARAGDLHPVARISSEADDDGLACLPGPRWRGGCHVSTN